MFIRWLRCRVFKEHSGQWCCRVCGKDIAAPLGTFRPWINYMGGA